MEDSATNVIGSISHDVKEEEFVGEMTVSQYGSGQYDATVDVGKESSR